MSAPVRRLSEPERQRTGRRERTVVEHGATEVTEPSFLERQREARPWLDHLVRAGGRYSAQKGDYYAAGITYFSLLAIAPLLMVAFAVLGFVLAGNEGLITEVRDAIAGAVPPELNSLVTPLLDSAITSRGSVGIIGLVGALYSGLGWMANIRNALTAQWDQRHEPESFVRTKLVDLAALVGLGAALLVTGLLSVVGGAGTTFALELVGLDTVPGAFLVTRLLAIVLSVAATWAVFTWVIARLPREKVTGRSAVRAALGAALVFEVFKQVAGLYLTSVISGPAGAIFGTIIGLLVFVFITSRLLLFATAWAATAEENMAMAAVAVPGPAVVTTQVHTSTGPGLRGSLALVGIGAATALGLTWGRRRPRG